ncbi:ribosome biogenesis protein SLX9-domain-containing protein [Phanerochaete sordida]|uniref:Ribosome biogenesis protein SLX9 n=1 Tax=Phanerochaete sordida TaxID=48140 RepID=A0A9P3L867_9APHY|nr:ribosome biogenesis protein SLX9-domain-containing protein [Phanerochaete sordida]
MPDAQLAPDAEALPEPTSKREKQLLKHEKFLQRLEASRSPYSKSHERRLKRKAKEQVASGLDEIKAAISAVEVAEGLAPAEDGEAPRKPKLAPGQIGEGKHTTLSKAQRKKALAMERMRIPKILSTPEFSSNPFQTLRKHAENTLVKHEVPT